jgi:uncharacterized protein YndB with AHSA1/START domain
MAAGKSSETAMRNQTTRELPSDREILIARAFNGPPRIVFEAWTRPELFKRWWVPKSTGIVLRSAEMDVRTGGSYRLEFGQDAANTFAFFGKYLEVTPPSRLVWTNEETEQGAVTTVTFEEKAGKTLLTLHELYPSKEAFDEASGMEGGLPESFEQLDELLATLGAGTGG